MTSGSTRAAVVRTSMKRVRGRGLRRARRNASAAARTEARSRRGTIACRDAPAPPAGRTQVRQAQAADLLRRDRVLTQRPLTAGSRQQFEAGSTTSSRVRRPCWRCSWCRHAGSSVISRRRAARAASASRASASRGGNRGLRELEPADGAARMRALFPPEHRPAPPTAPSAAASSVRGPGQSRRPRAVARDRDRRTRHVCFRSADCRSRSRPLRGASASAAVDLPHRHALGPGHAQPVAIERARRRSDRRGRARAARGSPTAATVGEHRRGQRRRGLRKPERAREQPRRSTGADGAPRRARPRRAGAMRRVDRRAADRCAAASPTNSADVARSPCVRPRRPVAVRVAPALAAARRSVADGDGRQRRRPPRSARAPTIASGSG